MGVKADKKKKKLIKLLAARLKIGWVPSLEFDWPEKNQKIF